jgi:hypothetical protein
MVLEGKEVDEECVGKLKNLNHEVAKKPSSSPFHFELSNSENILEPIIADLNFSSYFQKAFSSLQVTDSTKPSKHSRL